MSADSHASKRKNMQPKKRSVRKGDEMLSEIRRKKKKIEETGGTLSEQKLKSAGGPRKDKQGPGAENSSTQPTVTALHSGMGCLSHSNGTGALSISKVFLGSDKRVEGLDGGAHIGVHQHHLEAPRRD